MMTAPAHSRLQHLVSVDQLDRARIERLYARASRLAVERDPTMAGRIMAALFYEPSTRTRLSFEAAMYRLGGSVISEIGRDFSSQGGKGESLDDTIRMASAYADIIVLRHDEIGAAARAAAVSAVPVINAGDGPGEHPTQALLDVYTIQRELGRIDGTHLALCGDLRYSRMIYSLPMLLGLFTGVRLTFVAPDIVQVGPAMQQKLRDRAIPFRLTDSFEHLDDVDVVYQTRIQKERFADVGAIEAARGKTRIDAAVMALLPATAIVMHNLPRVDEIAPEVDSDPRAAYFRQAANGVAVRMALLEEMLR